MLIRVLQDAFPAISDEWKQIIVTVSVLSMLLGAFAAIGQTNIKRLMAYSSIGHVGYALVGIAAGSPEGISGVMVYLAIYVVMTLGTFACILAMRRKGEFVEEIADLRGLWQTQPMLAFMLAMLLFSMAGIQPLAGFFAKFYVFLAAIHAGLYGLAVIGVLASVVGAYYYLRIIKIMYFDEPAERFEPMPGILKGVLAVSGGLVLCFFLRKLRLQLFLQLSQRGLQDKLFLLFLLLGGWWCLRGFLLDIWQFKYFFNPFFLGCCCGGGFFLDIRQFHYLF